MNLPPTFDLVRLFEGFEPKFNRVFAKDVDVRYLVCNRWDHFDYVIESQPIPKEYEEKMYKCTVELKNIEIHPSIPLLQKDPDTCLIYIEYDDDLDTEVTTEEIESFIEEKIRYIDRTFQHDPTIRFQNGTEQLYHYLVKFKLGSPIHGTIEYLKTRFGEDPFIDFKVVGFTEILSVQG